MYGTHITAKKKNVPAGVSEDNITGVSCPIRNVPIQSDNPAIDIAAPLTLTGYISDRRTKITAQIDMAHEKI